MSYLIHCSNGIVKFPNFPNLNFPNFSMEIVLFFPNFQTKFENSIWEHCFFQSKDNEFCTIVIYFSCFSFSGFTIRICNLEKSGYCTQFIQFISVIFPKNAKICQFLKPGPGPWTRTLKNLDPEKPGP